MAHSSKLVSVFSNFKNFLIFQLILIKLASKLTAWKYLTAGDKKVLRCLPFCNKSWALVNQPCKMFTGSSICNNDYGVNIGQVTSSRLCRRCTNLRILSGISGVSRNKQNESKISILGSQKSKKVTKILHSNHWNLYQFYQNKIL